MSFLVILLGFAIIIWLIWIRFIRERLPKDIPFDLTEIKFYFLLYICFVYLYIIKSLLFPKKPHPFMAKIVKMLYLPLTTLDNSIKNNKYVSNLYNKILTFYIERTNKFTFSHMCMLYFIYNILPRIFLVSLLCINIFYFYKLELIYDFILIGIFPLLYRYIKYSFKNAKEQYLNLLNNKYDKVWVSDKNYTTIDWEYDPNVMLYHDKRVSIEEYLNIQVENFFNLNFENKIEYEGDVFAKEEVYVQYTVNKYKNQTINLTDEYYIIIEKEYNDIMPKLLTLSICLHAYSHVSTKSKIKYIRIIIYTLYFICWSYILFVSYPSIKEFLLTEEVIQLIIPYIDYIEPFSEISLKK